MRGRLHVGLSPAKGIQGNGRRRCFYAHDPLAPACNGSSPQPIPGRGDSCPCVNARVSLPAMMKENFEGNQMIEEWEASQEVPKDSLNKNGVF